jgi:hypothetical protein
MKGSPMAGFTIKITRSGNVITEANGFSGETCISKAEEIMTKLKQRGIGVHIETFHRKSEDCPEVLVHVTEKGK